MNNEGFFAKAVLIKEKRPLICIGGQYFFGLKQRMLDRFEKSVCVTSDCLLSFIGCFFDVTNVR